MKLSADQMPWFDHISFNQNQIIYDLIYEPNPTRFLQKAQKDGARAINGLGMLVHQGAFSFHIWTGIHAPVDVMKKAVLESKI